MATTPFLLLVDGWFDAALEHSAFFFLIYKIEHAQDTHVRHDATDVHTPGIQNHIQSFPSPLTDVAHPQGGNATRVLGPLHRQYDDVLIPTNCTAHFHGKTSPLRSTRYIAAPQQRGMRLVPLFILRRAQFVQLHIRIIATPPVCGTSYRLFSVSAIEANTTIFYTHRCL